MKYILDHFGSMPDKNTVLIDKTDTDVFSSLSCAPFICTPSFLNKDCCNDDSNYMVLIPNLGYGKVKAKKQTAEIKLQDEHNCLSLIIKLSKFMKKEVFGLR